MWRQAWAKSAQADDYKPARWLPLAAHLTDSGRTMGLLWDHWAGEGPRRVIEGDFGDAEEARDVAILAAGLHDVGKLSRAFAFQVDELRWHMEDHGFAWHANPDRSDSRRLPHSTAGHLIVRDLLVGHGAAPKAAEAFAVVIGGHHGVPPSQQQLDEARALHWLMGDEHWAQAQADLIDHVLTELDLHQAVKAAAQNALSDASQMLLTGLVITADWIASHDTLFPLMPLYDQVSEPSAQRAERAWARLALPRPWKPTDESLTADATDLLRSRFAGAQEYEANDMQRLALQAARELPGPGLIIIEALMGLGKTEASKMAAEMLAHRFGRSGVFYGLPTRATTDAMFDRVLPWWSSVPDANDSGIRSTQLRHSGAPLNRQFQSLPRSGRAGAHDGTPFSDVPADVGREEDEVPQWSGRRHTSAEAIAHHWTSGRKKAALADTVIATIDHELLAALSSRHVVLRHLGLSRQVVVLDEVHAADTWMFVYLERTLEWLGRYGVPVIALSATLPPDQRTAMVQAYERGRRVATKPKAASRPGLVRRSSRPTTTPLPDVPATPDYPLLTTLADGVVRQYAGAPAETRQVWMQWFTDDTDELADLLGAELTDGGCAVVVCNTVVRAVDRYVALRERFGERVSLAHSRFIAADRARKDEWLRETFGPPRPDRDRALRDGKIVVATQVVEQSLDIDFDLLVTDLAPIDLVLQRVGRLHRHERGATRPERLRQPRCVVTAFDPESGDVDRGGKAVYGEHLLLRSASLIDEIVSAEGALTLPSDVPTLVQRCYGTEELGRPEWAAAMASAQLEHHRRAGNTVNNAGNYRLRAPGESATLVGLLAANTGEADTEAVGSPQVREPDGGFEVLLLEKADDGLRLLTHLDDDRRIPKDQLPDRDTTRQLAQSMVRIPGWITSNPRALDAVLDDLNANYYPAWQKDPILGGQLILTLGPDGVGRMGPFTASYDPETGLEISRAAHP